MRELQTALKLHKFINTANCLVLLTDSGLRHYWHLLHGVLHSLLARLHLRELLLHTRHHCTGVDLAFEVEVACFDAAAWPYDDDEESEAEQTSAASVVV